MLEENILRPYTNFINLTVDLQKPGMSEIKILSPPTRTNDHMVKESTKSN